MPGFGQRVKPATPSEGRDHRRQGRVQLALPPVRREVLRQDVGGWRHTCRVFRGKRRRRATTGSVARPQAAAAVDPYDRDRPQFVAYLDQARWLLEQQQRRGASFQQTAVAVIGFDGVLLAVLVSGDSLGSTGRYTGAWWATVTSAALFVLSSLAGVLALRPRATNAVAAGLTIDAWKDLHDQGSWNRAHQHFAEMLLSPDPPVAGRPRRADRLRRRWRAFWRLPEPPRQPLLAATHLATVRGRWVTGAAALLVAGLASLGIALLTAQETATPDPAAASAPAVVAHPNPEGRTT